VRGVFWNPNTWMWEPIVRRRVALDDIEPYPAATEDEMRDMELTERQLAHLRQRKCKSSAEVA
jgi:hypothetical protein